MAIDHDNVWTAYICARYFINARLEKVVTKVAAIFSPVFQSRSKLLFDPHFGRQEIPYAKFDGTAPVILCPLTFAVTD